MHPRHGAALLLLLAGPAGAAPSWQALWVELPDAAAHAHARALGMGFAEGQQGAWWRMDGPPGVTGALDAHGLRWRPAALARASDEDAYHDAAEVLALLQALAEADPERVEVVDLGRSSEGRTLRAVRIGVAEAPRAAWRLVGTHHGDEWASSEVALHAAVELARAAGDPRADPALHALLQTDQVWVLPQLNPDGFEAAQRYSATTVDLNRNYDFAWTEEEWLPGDAPFSEPETRALRALQTWVPFAAGLSFHAGAANVGWVWNHRVDPSPDDDLLQALADRYADACTTPDFWRTNGAAWYQTWGDVNDWAYGRQGTLDFTVEVSVEKIPAGSDLPALRAQHWPAVRAFLLGAEPAWGQVRDARSGLGLPATVAIVEGGGSALTGPDGRFARHLAGPVTLEVSAPGHQTRQVEAEPGAALVVELERADLVQVRPEPLHLPADQVVTFHLDVDSRSLLLSRPGHEPVRAMPAGTGWVLDTTGMAPGPWDLELEDGVAPRSLFVEERDEALRIDAIELRPGELVLWGEGFAAGTRAWALLGPERAPQPLALRSWDGGSLVLEAARAEGPVDVVVLSAGRQVVLPDVGAHDGADADTGATDTGADSGDGSATPPVQARACACTGGASPPPLASAPLFLSLLLLRRRSRT